MLGSLYAVNFNNRNGGSVVSRPSGTTNDVAKAVPDMQAARDHSLSSNGPTEKVCTKNWCFQRHVTGGGVAMKANLRLATISRLPAPRERQGFVGGCACQSIIKPVNRVRLSNGQSVRGTGPHYSSFNREGWGLESLNLSSLAAAESALSMGSAIH